MAIGSVNEINLYKMKEEKRMRKRVLATVLALAMSLAALTACGAEKKEGAQTSEASKTDEASEGETNITFMGWGSPAEVEVFQTMIKQYEEAYPNVKVEYINVPDSEYDTKLQTMIAAGQQPDVFYLRPENVGKFADTENVYDMSEYVANNEIFKEENIWEKALNMYRYDGVMPGEGAIYGLPKDIGPFALAYNKTLFEAANIELPDNDEAWRWSEFVENAKKLTQGEGPDKVYGSAQYSLESAVWSNGADWLDASKTKVTVDDEKFVEAVQWMADLALVHGVMPNAEEEAALSSYQRWLEGKIGMMGIGPWSQGQFWSECDFEWDLMPWPVSDSTGEHAIWYGGIGFGVNPASKDIEAACNLAAFFAFDEAAQRTNFEMGQAIPNLKDMTFDEYMKMDNAPENKQEFIDILEDEHYGRRATQTYTYDSEWFGEFNSGVSAVWSGEMTAQEYSDDVKEVMQNLLDSGIEKQEAARK